MLDSDFILGIFSQDRELAIKEFIENNEMKNEDKYLDDYTKYRLTDKEAIERINETITGYTIAQIKSLPKTQRDEVVGRIKEIEGLTQRQISRILGISLSPINRA